MTMEQSRQLRFALFCLAFLGLWYTLVVPRLVPQPAANQEQPGDGDKGEGVPVAGKNPGDKQPPGQPAAPKGDGVKPALGDKPVDGDKPENPVVQPEKPALKKFPRKLVTLGSTDPTTGYRLEAVITSRGAAIRSVRLADRRYRDLVKPHPPITLLGTSSDPLLLDSLAYKVETAAEPLSDIDWDVKELLPAEAPHREVVLGYTSPSTGLELTKRFVIEKVGAAPQDVAGKPAVAKDAGGKEGAAPKPAEPGAGGPLDESAAYLVHCDFQFTNTQKAPTSFRFVMQGPNGLPLENVDNVPKYRDIVGAFVSESGAVTITRKTAAEHVKKPDEEWHRPIKYLGLDVQFFAAVVIPRSAPQAKPIFHHAIARSVGKEDAAKTDLSLEFHSQEQTLPADGTLQQRFDLFVGPKREDLVKTLDITDVVHHGMLWWVSRPMLSLLAVFETLTGSYGIAIILLTVCVRLLMLPLSLDQARGAVKMQALQPEIAALRAKYANDQQKMAQAQMELFRKHNYNPLAGCLPMLVQLPIFMGLYSALNLSVDLRMAKFLWMQNLAAPDALFPLGFKVPWMGWTDFNLLPLVTIALFVVQQKLFMPPPMNEEQEQQHKMMNIMMIVMGAMFYRVPSGLCVYFIASSLWGMAERLLLPKAPAGKPATDADAAASTTAGKTDRKADDTGRNGKAAGDEEKPEGFLGWLMRQAEKPGTVKNDTASWKRK